MKSRFFFWILRRAQYTAVSLIALLVASSCAPAATNASASPTVESVPATAAQVDSSSAGLATLVPPQIVEVQAIATSRGPNLEATDPATVTLASGQFQLVEFFRFT
ncbi:MAG: hypothetical protein Q8L41_06635 [Anaerolineales bacterium]|nr:hypothetical protein [Anaerolineales bacterium]MDP2777290.1 hypothetical protein [Anaerolineales bacterium]